MSDRDNAADKNVVMGEKELLALLDGIGIPYVYAGHAPVMTVAESRELRSGLVGEPCKCLFLENKKQLWLAAVPADLRVDLKTLAQRLESGRLSFAPAERMQEVLGVTPGGVTALAVVNDTQGLVTVVVEKSLLSKGSLLFHPMVNTASVSLSPESLLRFLDHAGHTPRIVDIAPDMSPGAS